MISQSIDNVNLFSDPNNKNFWLGLVPFLKIENFMYFYLSKQMDTFCYKCPMSNVTPKSVLITGGAGFIASHMVIHLVKNYPDLTVVNLDKIGYASSIKLTDSIANFPNYHFVKGNILNEDLIYLLLQTYNVDTVMHFAGETHVDNSFGQSLNFTKNNVLGSHVLVECCRQNGNIKRFIHVSTDEVYGESAYGKTGATEHTSLLIPTNPYAATKAAAEHIMLSYYKSFNFPVIITRSNNIYGPHQLPEKVVPKWICRLERGEKIPVHGNGSVLRSFLFIDDVVRAYELILYQGTIGEVYNISSDIELSTLALAQKMAKLWNRDPEEAIEFVADRAVNDERYHINDVKIRALGWKPEISLEDGLKRTIDWYKGRDLKLIWDSYSPSFLAAHPTLPIKHHDFFEKH